MTESFTEGLGPCIAVCIACNWAGIGHHSTAEHNPENYAKLIARAKEVIPADRISTIRPILLAQTRKLLPGTIKMPTRRRAISPELGQLRLSRMQASPIPLSTGATMEKLRRSLSASLIKSSKAKWATSASSIPSPNRKIKHEGLGRHSLPRAANALAEAANKVSFANLRTYFRAARAKREFFVTWNT
jgi:hypothetical protein